MARLLIKVGRFTYNHALFILLFTLTSVGVAAYGISKINVNDNPIKWFAESHPIRVADRVLNEHFGGTRWWLIINQPLSTGGYGCPPHKRMMFNYFLLEN